MVLVVAVVLAAASAAVAAAVAVAAAEGCARTGSAAIGRWFSSCSRGACCCLVSLNRTCWPALGRSAGPLACLPPTEPDLPTLVAPVPAPAPAPGPVLVPAASASPLSAATPAAIAAAFSLARRSAASRTARFSSFSSLVMLSRVSSSLCNGDRSSAHILRFAFELNDVRRGGTSPGAPLP